MEAMQVAIENMIHENGAKTTEMEELLKELKALVADESATEDEMAALESKIWSLRDEIITN